MYNLDLKLDSASVADMTIPVIDDGPGATTTFIWLDPTARTPLMLVRSQNAIEAAYAISKKLYVGGEAPLLVVQRILSSVIPYSPESRIWLGFSDRRGLN